MDWAIYSEFDLVKSPFLKGANPQKAPKSPFKKGANPQKAPKSPFKKGYEVA